MAWRPRWYHWTVATITLLVLVPVVAAMAWRAEGFRRYDAVVAEQKARGVSTTLDELIALAPAVDRTRQRRWRAWMDRGLNIGVDSVHLDSAGFDDWATGVTSGPPAKVLDDLRKVETYLADGRALLAEGPAVLTGFGWMDEHFASGRRDCLHASMLPLANLLTCRLMASGSGVAALVADQPTSDLAALDGMSASFAASATMIDAMIAIALDAIRDEAYLRLAVLGRLDDAAAQRWLREEPRAITIMADALRGDRLLGVTPLMADERAQTLASGDLFGLDLDPAQRALWFIFTSHDCATGLRLHQHAEERLRRLRPDAPSWQTQHRGMYGAGFFIFANLGESAIMAWEYDTTHRLRRLGLRLMMSAQAVPADHDAFVAAYANDIHLAAGPDRASLVYERLSERRFRLSIDPATPVPDFADPARIPGRVMLGKPSKRIGKPARAPVLDVSGIHVEADVGGQR